MTTTELLALTGGEIRFESSDGVRYIRQSKFGRGNLERGWIDGDNHVLMPNLYCADDVRCMNALLQAHEAALGRQWEEIPCPRIDDRLTGKHAKGCDICNGLGTIRRRVTEPIGEGGGR